MITSKGRTLFFGPHSSLMRANVRYSNMLNGVVCKVSGIFLDTTSMAFDYPISIGAALVVEGYEGYNVPVQEAPVATLQAVHSPFPEEILGTTFFTKHNLLYVRNLKVQRSGSRCMGLLIERGDGSIDVLGQWNPMRQNTTTTLYSREMNRPLQSITFIYSGNDAHVIEKHVEDIVLNESETTKPSFRLEELSEVFQARSGYCSNYYTDYVLEHYLVVYS